MATVTAHRCSSSPYLVRKLMTGLSSCLTGARSGPSRPPAVSGAAPPDLLAREKPSTQALLRGAFARLCPLQALGHGHGQASSHDSPLKAACGIRGSRRRRPASVTPHSPLIVPEPTLARDCCAATGLADRKAGTGQPGNRRLRPCPGSLAHLAVRDESWCAPRHGISSAGLAGAGAHVFPEASQEWRRHGGHSRSKDLLPPQAEPPGCC